MFSMYFPTKSVSVYLSYTKITILSHLAQRLALCSLLSVICQRLYENGGAMEEMINKMTSLEGKGAKTYHMGKNLTNYTMQDKAKKWFDGTK